MKELMPQAEKIAAILKARNETITVAESSTGRGASLHARPACLDTGLRSDVLSRAFKRRVTVRDTTELLQRITIASRRKR